MISLESNPTAAPRHIAFCLSVFFGVVAMAPACATVPPATQRTIVDPDVYSIYAGLVSHSWLVTDARAKVLVVQKETPGHWPCTLDHMPPDPKWREAFDAFRSRLATGGTWMEGRSLGHPYKVKPEKDLFRLDFLRRNPDARGYLRFSDIGFDSTKTRSVLAMDHWCGGECGGGGYHFLEKVDNQWVPAKGPGLVGPCGWMS